MLKTCVYYNLRNGRVWKNHICTGNGVVQLDKYISQLVFFLLNVDNYKIIHQVGVYFFIFSL